MKQRIWILLLLVLLLCGCAAEPIKETTAVTTAAVTEVLCTEVAVTTTAAPSITVSPLATADFLQPIESYSWAREFAPEYVVLHFTSAVVLSPDAPYDLQTVRGIFEDSGVSIHYIIDRDGTILCYIPEDRAAWHAGKGTFGGDARLTNAMNKYSIGIELLAIGSEQDMAQYLTAQEYRSLDPDLLGFTDVQYTALQALLGDICARNDIPLDSEHILGHSMYNPQKSDPGELFDWNRILE